jgi:prepilin-type N-terminal cleavage/methylation domain-containing protein
MDLFRAVPGLCETGFPEPSGINAARHRRTDGSGEPSSQGSGCAGFTLLEVLVALTVLAVGAALTLSLISGSLGNIRKVQLRTRTIEHAQTVMELALLDQSIQQATAFNGDFEDGTRWTVRVEEYVLPDNQPGLRNQERQKMPVKLLHYTVEMTGPDSRAPDYHLQTLKLVRAQAEERPLGLPR